MADKKKKTKTTASAPAPSAQRIPVGPKLSFGAAEAYKLLRANLMFSANSEEHCPIIGVTSSVRGEGKTTTSINLAYSLAEADKRVLLIDGDLRLPKVAKTLRLASAPGFSNMLAGMTQGRTPTQLSGLHDNLYVITSGDIPPNPSELLGSKAAEITMQVLGECFDYIVIDLPPVNIVSDALVLSKLCTGFLVVVRQDYTSRRELDNCVDQLGYVNAKILGFLMTHSTVAEKGGYKGTRYYKRYGYRYGKRYGYGNGYGYGYGYGTAYGRFTEEPAENPAEPQSGAVRPE